MASNKNKSVKDYYKTPLLQNKGNTSSEDKVCIEMETTSTKKREFFERNAPKSTYTKSAASENRQDQKMIMEKSLKFLNAVKSQSRYSMKNMLEAGVDVNTAFGGTKFTALHYAVSIDDLQMVEKLLEYKANPHAKDSIQRTPFLIAAAMGHGGCLSAMIRKKTHCNTVVGSNPSEGNFHCAVEDVCITSMEEKIKMPASVTQGSTALHEASRSSSLECVKILLDDGADAEVEDGCGRSPLLLAGEQLDASQIDAIKCYEKVVQLLLRKNTSKRDFRKKMATLALPRAVTLKSMTAMKFLMDAEANPGWCGINRGDTTAIHEAASNGSVEMLRVLITHDKVKGRQSELANVQDSMKYTPLHKAASAGSHDCVLFLLKYGANLSLRAINGSGKGISALEAIMMHIPNSKTFLNSVLDSYITCNSNSLENPNLEVTLDFSLLAPEGCLWQTAVLNVLFTSDCIGEKKRALIHHPLIEAFVRLKWHALRKYFFLLVFIYALFVISLSTLTSLEYLNPEGMPAIDEKWIQLSVTIFWCSTVVLAAIELLIVIVQCACHFQYYMRQPETWTNGLASLLSIIWCIAKGLSFVNDKTTPEWPHHVMSICLPFSWAGLMFLFGRFPICGSQALLFSVVFKSVMSTFLAGSCMLIGFSFSFFIQFHKVNPDAFGNPWKSFFNTIVMMTGEYDYLNLFAEKQATLPVTSRLLFFIFILVASIVIMNIIIGLSVTDTQSMNLERETRSLYKMAEFVDLLEIMAKPIAKYCALDLKEKIKIYDDPGDKNHAKKCLPSDLIDSLIEIAIEQRDEKKNLTSTSANELFHFFTTKLISLEGQISDILETFKKELSQNINGKDSNVELNIRGNSSAISSHFFSSSREVERLIRTRHLTSTTRN